MTTVAILLAAGASSRLGTVKALLPLEGDQAAVRVLAGRYARHAGRCLVATGYHADRVEAAIAGLPHVAAVRNPAPERGQLSSLQCALAHVAAGPDVPEWFLFAPVDCFDIDDAVLGPLLAALGESDPGTLLTIPESGGKHGHPVAARWSVAAELLTLDPADMARTVIHRLRSRTHYVPMDDAAFLRDIDTPSDWEARQQANAAADRERSR